MARYRELRIEEFVGEKALICTCFGVSEQAIIQSIEEYSLTDVEEVAGRCRAGSGCGSCRMLIQELIDTAGDSA
jgi:NifU-like protein